MLSRLGYYFFVKPVSLLPFSAIYVLSDFTYLILYRIIGYRKKVVVTNLKNSFPDKDEAWIKKTTSDFYRHFCDLILESIKLFSIRESQIQKRFVFENPEEMNEDLESGRSVILCGGHYNNWEILAVGIARYLRGLTAGIYKQLSNEFYDLKVNKSRGQFGLRMLPTTDVSRFFEEKKRVEKTVIFATDQSPTHAKKVFWTNFLNQETAMAFGTEKYAVEYNHAVYFGFITKTSRGRYSFKVQKICDDPSSTSYGEITRKHSQILEQQIIEKPEYWLWTHRRWKRKRREDEVLHP
ncbi:MAG: hypothetical protein GC181_04675 [Bacteroidetes bacterium]|nr:hypothetical protein [Bacteroidota bacterium]